ncbi:hypothetical protein [Methylomonas sp. AM2-LC]|uniref:hypothetical protein n=1 Tax=Methylomonas sp. AM2-LC TaxID=3153301 RepID=UPI003267AE51
MTFQGVHHDNFPIQFLRNFFSKKSVQAYLARSLEGKELTCFFPEINNDDLSKQWIPLKWNIKELSHGYCDTYYCILGTSHGEWIFAPSMEGIPFFMNGEPVTVVCETKD